MKLDILKLGKHDYDKTLEIQYDLLKKRQNGEIGDTLILVEHPNVITLGRNAEESNIIFSKEYLKSIGIDVFNIGRGGDVTYHGPGQIVGYPIVNFKHLKLGVREFVESLEEVFIQLLKDNYNIIAGRHPKHRGVWIGDKKITAIGLSIKKWVTMHGFAFNVNTNLDNFKYIVPCGITDMGVTSLEQLIGKKSDLDKMNELVLKYFIKIFNVNDYKEITL